MQNLSGYLVRKTPRSVKNIIGKPLRRLLGAAASSGSLEQLGVKHATDKLPNGYLARYQKHFEDRRLDVRTVIEIGVGGYQYPDKGGESLRLWADFFPNAHIHGIDIHDKSPHNAARITTHRGSQVDRAFLDKVISETGAPDIIVDDGSHINEHIIASFEILFPHLARGGYYVIEDMGTSYQEEYGGDALNLERKDIATGYIKDFVDIVNSRSIEGRARSVFDGEIAGFSVYPSMCFIEKAK